MSHEQAYVQDIVRAATAHGEVVGVRVEVGELAPIPATELEAALRFTGWELDVVTKPGTVQCRCGVTGRPRILDKGHDYTIFTCASCGAEMPPIMDGKDVVVREVRVK